MNPKRPFVAPAGRLLFALALAGFGRTVPGQPVAQEPAAAKTAVPSFLSEEEAAVLAELNLARTRPREYAQFARDYLGRFEGNVYRVSERVQLRTREGPAAVREAIRFLEQAKPLEPLAPSHGLSLSARDHVLDSGPTGRIGHAGSDGSTPETRVNRHGRWRGKTGEVIAYGPKGARAFVLQLIVDDGVPDRGHRISIFDPDFRVAGVSVGRHLKFGSMCVVEFAARYDETPEPPDPAAGRAAPSVKAP